MSDINSQRKLIQILNELHTELDFGITFHCFDWIIELNRGLDSYFIFGYDWPLNSSSSQQIAKDKNATFEILKRKSISTIEHILFLRSENFKYLGSNGNWLKMLELLDLHKNIVVKSNTGTGGNDVYRVDSIPLLETVIHKLFEKNRSICVSPFYSINEEYRVIVLNKTIQLIFSKKRPLIIGDGKSDILSLIKNYMPNLRLIDLQNLDIDSDLILSSIPENNKHIYLNWKHNLGQGSVPEIVKNEELIEILSSLALSAADAIDISFGSVDIVEIKGDYKVMEINSGVMMENFANYEYGKAKEIYQNAVSLLLKI